MFSFDHNATQQMPNGLSRCVTLCAKHAVAMITGRVFMVTTRPRKYP